MQSQADTLDKSCKEKLLPESHSPKRDTVFFGPALPPHLLRKNFLEDKKTETCEPTLPDHFSENKKEELTGATLPVSEQEVKILIGPEIPEYLKTSQSWLEVNQKPAAAFNEADNFGPSTSLMAAGDESTYKFICVKNLNKQTSQNVNESTVKRETWMTELPKKKGAKFGLFPRHFKSRIQTDKETDDSVWTDTPADREKKYCHQKINDHKEILQMKRLKERDKEMEKLVKKAAKKLKKKQSLLEMHAESMKKKKKIDSKKQKLEGKTLPERRPFDRNVDLQVRKIDENQKRAILHKSQFLNDRFAPGQSKFL